jgi:3',5'-cyclic AMP phosphodiesterase CpdA
LDLISMTNRLVTAVLLIAALAVPAAQAPPLVRFGVVTDIHYADIDPAGARTYRESHGKLAECVQVMNAKGVAFLVELGDFKDQDKAPDAARTLKYLETIESVFAAFKGPRYHVIGNHDTDSLSKAQFLAAAPNTGIVPNATRYSFVSGGVRFVVLDASHTSDGSDYDRGNFDWSDSNVDAPQLDWLAKTLTASVEPAVVLVHQQLDGTGAYYVKNAAQVRELLEKSGKVIAVLQGHRHEGGFSSINGIPYFTFKGLIEGAGPWNSSYSIVDVMPDLSVRVLGYRQAETRSFRAGAASRGVSGSDDPKLRTSAIPNR